MNTITITVSEYAHLYGCTPQFVSRNLRNEIGMVGMISYRKIDGKTSGWLIEVLKTWYDSKKN